MQSLRHIRRKVQKDRVCICRTSRQVVKLVSCLSIPNWAGIGVPGQSVGSCIFFLNCHAIWLSALQSFRSHHIRDHVNGDECCHVRQNTFCLSSQPKMHNTVKAVSTAKSSNAMTYNKRQSTETLRWLRQLIVVIMVIQAAATIFTWECLTSAPMLRARNRDVAPWLEARRTIVAKHIWIISNPFFVALVLLFLGGGWHFFLKTSKNHTCLSELTFAHVAVWNDGRCGTFEEDLERCISLGRHNTSDIFIQDVGRSGRCFPERGCVLEHQIFRFAKRFCLTGANTGAAWCSTSYDLASLFRAGAML